MTEEIYRSFDIQEVDLEARTIEGILAPYNDTYESNGYKERYERGLFGDVQETFLYFNHDHQNNLSAAPIGKVIETRDEEDGFHIKARLSTTPKGQEVYTLLQEEVLNSFSAGFIGMESRQDDDVRVWTKARLLEASVVPHPAYKAAAVVRVRSADTNNNEEVFKEKTMENETSTSTDVVELRSAVETLDRKVANLSLVANDTPSLPQFRSIGEYVKAVATGQVSEADYRAFTGMDSSVAIKDKTPVANHIDFIDKGRKIMGLFQKEALPKTGNSVDYYVLNTNTLQAGVQAAEGDNLPTGAVSFAARTAPVKTIGGWAPLSRQAVERAQLPLLDSVYKGLGLAYAQATEGQVRATLAAASGTGTATLGTLSSATFANWSDVVVDSAFSIEDNTGLDAEYIIVSPDVFKVLVKMSDGAGRPLMNVHGDGVNNVGQANLAGLTGSIFGLTVVAVSGLAAKTVWVANSNAITVWESPGAPFRLQDSDVVSLTEQYSLYGYIASAVTQPAGLVKVTVA